MRLFHIFAKHLFAPSILPILLARELDADITALDFLPEFLDELQARANDHGVANRTSTLNCSMDALPFAEGEFDVIWSEGAV